MHERIVKAWTERDRDALARDLGPDLLTEWVRRLDDFDRKGWHNVCEIRGISRVEYLGLTNREDDREDRVVVRLEAVLRDVVIDASGHVVGCAVEAGIHMRRGDDGRRALCGERIQQRVGLAVGRWTIVDAGDDVRVHVDERPDMRTRRHGSTIDANRGGLEGWS